MVSLARYAIILFILILSPPKSFPATEGDLDVDEDIFEFYRITPNESGTLDIIETYLNSPLDLQDISPARLSELPGFNYSLSKKIIALANVNSDYSDISDSLNLNQRLEYILRNCTFIQPQYKNSARFSSRIRNNSIFHKLKGFEDNKFLGSDLDLYQRYTYVSGLFACGLLLDKDIGEQKINDHTSAFLKADFNGYELILGDYYLELGMGSLFWGGYGMGKGSDIISPVLQPGRKIRPYTSTMDNLFFRGAAARYKINALSGAFDICSWLSYAPRSANIENDTAQSIYNNSYYRTETEIDKKYAFDETCFGTELQFSTGPLKTGLLLSYLYYENYISSIAKTSFHGRQGVLASLYTQYLKDDFSAGIEISKDGSGKYGLKAGCQYFVNDFEFAVGTRYFDSLFRAPFGYSFGEWDAPANETGIYAGCVWKGIDKMNFSAYCDIYKTIGHTYFIPEPVSGFDIFSEADMKLARGSHALFRLQHEEKDDFYKNNQEEKILYTKSKTKIRLDIRTKLYPKVQIRGRVELSAISFDGNYKRETGILSFLDLKWSAKSWLKLYSRATYFSTPSYESAIWQFEAPAPGYMRSVPLYGSGFRLLLGLKTEPVKYLRINMRFALTKKYNVESMGSGYMEIPGDEHKTFLVQADLQI